MSETEAGLRPARSKGAFVGRDADLSHLVAALPEPNAFVLIEGDAGMGKTRLVTECLQAPELHNLRAISAECLPLVEPFPLGPLAELLHAQPLAELELSPLASALRPLLPEWAEVLPPAPEPLDDPQAVRHRVLRAVAEVVSKLAADVLVVEDVHWADSATLEFLLMLSAGLPGDLRLLLTCRPLDVSPESPLLRITARKPHTRVYLEPLDVDAARQMVVSMFDTDDVSSSFVEFLHRRTDGVPLALQESLALMLDRGDIVWRSGEWARRTVAGLEVPPSVRDSVIERVGRLEPPTRRLLGAAAVLGEPAEESLLGRVCGLAARPTRDALAQALDSALLGEVRAGRFQFRHVLASQAVEESIPVSERRRLHERAAAALRTWPAPPVARLCRHFREANDFAAWSVYGEAAADLALTAGDDRSAILLPLDLATHPEHPRDRLLKVARKLADAAAWGVAGLGDLGDRVVAGLSTILEHQVGPPAELAEIRLLLGRLLLQLGEFDSAAEQTELARVPLAGKPELAARAMMTLAWPRGREWSASRHAVWLDRAGELLPQVSDASDRMLLEVDRASVQLMLGRESGWDAPDRLRESATSLFEERQLARLLMNTGHVGIAWGRDDQARQRLDEAVRLMERTGYRRLLNSARLTSAYLDWLAGRWDGLAERIRALAGADDTLPEAKLEARATLARLDMVTGDRALAQRELAAVLDETVRRGVADGQLSPAAALSRLHLAGGSVDRALAVTSSALDTVVRKEMWLWSGGVVVVRLDALVQAGRVDEADELVRAFAAGLSTTQDVPAPEASLLVGRGIVAAANGRHRDATAHFAAAAQRWSRLPRPYDELLVLERQARAELASGDDDRALTRLMYTQKCLHERSAAWDADRIAKLLRSRGVEVARAWRGGRRGYGDRLSPREQEVAHLVAQGLTNRRVAQELFLSPRTVDRHLSAAMRKLGVTTRTALAVAIRDR